MLALPGLVVCLRGLVKFFSAWRDRKNCCFLKLGFAPFKAEQALQGMQLQKKRSTKGLRHTGILFRKNLKLKDAC